MKIANYSFEIDRVEKFLCLFPDEIEENPWVMYHGTSGFNVSSIERDGFNTQSSAISRESIQRVADIFLQMKWFGTTTGGFGTLKAFSLGHDLAQSEKGPTFFAEASLRALLFATREFAGGEKMYALRQAFYDLKAYLNDPALRTEHWEKMCRTYEGLRIGNAHPSELSKAAPVNVDLDWLERQLIDNQHAFKLAEDAFERHECGVVFALKMEPEDVESLTWHQPMGIKAERSVKSCRVIGRVDVPANLDARRVVHLRKDYSDRMGCGLLGALSVR